MFELFLTAIVEDRDLHTACAVLGGLCAMPAWEGICRVLYYQGPSRPAGISNQSSIDKPMRKDIGFFWKELHQNLMRQSFIIQARYDIDKENGLGPDAPPMDFDALSGILRWSDFPDPPHGRPFITQRKMVELWDQKRIPSILQDNGYQFKTEVVEHVYRFFREEAEFCLVRHYVVKPTSEHVPFETRSGESSPLQNLPSRDALTPVDQQRRWFLFVKMHVAQDNKPDEVRKAQEQLMAVRAELDGVFNFRPIDRKVHDTRVAPPQQGIQALPQKIVVGKR